MTRPDRSVAARILLVDDSDAMRALWRAWLSEEFGAFDVTEAASLAEAVDVVMSAPAVLLLDEHLAGGEGGLSLVPAVRRHAPDCEILLVTGDESVALEQRADAAGVADFLPKGELTSRSLRRHVRLAVGRHAARAELRRSEQRARSVLSALSEGVLLIDDSGVVVEANEPAGRILETSVVDLLGGPLGEAVTVVVDREDSASGRESLVGRALGTGEPETGVTVGLRPGGDGPEKICSISTRPLAEPGSQPHAVVMSITDITMATRQAQALAVKETHHRQVIRNLPGALVAVYGDDLRCTLLEGSYLREHGVNGDDLVGKHLTELVEPDQVDVLLGPMQRALRTGETTTVPFHAVPDDRRLLIEVLPYRDEHDAIVGVVNLSRDVTVEHEAREERRRAERRFEVAFDRAPIGMALRATRCGAGRRRGGDELCSGTDVRRHRAALRRTRAATRTTVRAFPRADPRRHNRRLT